MAIEWINWAIPLKTGSATNKAVLIAICNHADGLGYCWPSQKEIQKFTELSLRSIQRAMQDLEERGFLKRQQRRRADGTRSSDAYLLQRDGQPQGDTQAYCKKSAARQGDSHLGENSQGDTVSCSQGDTQSCCADSATSQAGSRVEADYPSSIKATQCQGNIYTSYISEPSLEPSPPRARAKTSLPPIPIPDWLDAGRWEEYLQHRRELSPKPFTPTAQRHAIAKLKKLKDEGNDPADVIRQTLESNWAGLFKLKELENDNGKKRATNRTDAISSALDEGFRRLYGTAPGSSQNPQRLAAAGI